MVHQVWFFLSLVMLAAGGMAPASVAMTQGDCRDGRTCVVELPGAACADGTPMFMNVTPQAGATKLYIFLEGGGACWDKGTCRCDYQGHCGGGMAKRLSRPNPKDVRSGWNGTAGSPVGSGYDIVEIPYCTGDVFIGNQLNNFGSSKNPAYVRQFGYRNLTIALAAIKSRFPEPERVIFMGSSAGGLGALFNLHQVEATYPETQIDLISDSGTPFKRPFLKGRGFDRVLATWNVATTLPADYLDLVPGPVDFVGMMRYNALRYPAHRYGFISAYDDFVMNTFSTVVGTDYGWSAVRRTIIDLADHDLGPNQHVFYVRGSRHTFTGMPAGRVASTGVTLTRWVDDMLSGASSWTDVRPDERKLSSEQVSGDGSEL